MTENKNQNIELSIESATPENATQLENIEQEETTDTPENVTQEDQTDIEIHNLEKKIINLCGKMYNLKHMKENKQKVIDQCTCCRE